MHATPYCKRITSHLSRYRTAHGVGRFRYPEWAPMVKRSTPRERCVGALESSHTHSHRAVWVVVACGVSDARQSHHTPATDPIVAPNSGAVASVLLGYFLALCTRLCSTGAQLRHHYCLGACSGDMTKCMRRHIANGSPHTSHGTARLTEWADSGTRSGHPW